MKEKLYLESSIISYLAMRTSRELIVAAHQAITQDWWENHRQNYEVYVSRTVLDEVQAGDPTMAEKRLSLLEGLSELEISDEVISLAKQLVQEGPLPEKARVDAFHIAAAVVHRMDYLMTWNCKHIANAHFHDQIRKICGIMGYDMIKICTPNELLEDQSDVS